MGAFCASVMCPDIVYLDCWAIECREKTMSVSINKMDQCSGTNLLGSALMEECCWLREPQIAHLCDNYT